MLSQDEITQIENALYFQFRYSGIQCRSIVDRLRKMVDNHDMREYFDGQQQTILRSAMTIDERLTGSALYQDAITAEVENTLIQELVNAARPYIVIKKERDFNGPNEYRQTLYRTMMCVKHPKEKH